MNVIIRAILIGGLTFLSTRFLLDGVFSFSDVVVGIIFIVLIINEYQIIKKKK